MGNIYSMELGFIVNYYESSSSCIMQEANHHLRSNPNLAVLSIETIEKKAREVNSVYKPLTIFKPGRYGTSAYWVKGLRLGMV